LIGIFWIFVSWEINFSESENSFSKSTEGFVSFINFIFKFISEFFLFTIKENFAASVEYSFWCTLKENLKVTTISAHVSNESVELNVR